MQLMKRLAMLVTPTQATATGSFVAVNLVSRIPGLGRKPTAVAPGRLADIRHWPGAAARLAGRCRQGVSLAFICSSARHKSRHGRNQPLQAVLRRNQQEMAHEKPIAQAGAAKRC